MVLVKVMVVVVTSVTPALLTGRPSPSKPKIMAFSVTPGGAPKLERDMT